MNQSPGMFFGPSSELPHPAKHRKLGGKLFLSAIVALVFLTSLLVAGGSWFLIRLYETLPSLTQMQNIEQSLVSRVLGNDGSLVHEFSIERRFWVPLDTIPDHLQKAVIAIEDRRFFQHWGVDIRRIFGAIFVNLVRRGYAQGASTLTQQLARNVYLTARASLIRKAREALTAVQLESCYTKREILELYLNQVYLGAGVYGVQAASEHYFSKPVWELDLNECSVLAGLIQLPERYRPDRKANLKRMTARRNAVLRAMRDMKVIDKPTFKAVLESPIETNPRIYRSRVGAYFVEMVRKQVADRYGDDLLYNGGLTIHTTLDPLAQDSAEASSRRQIESLQARLNRIFLDSTRADRRLKIPRQFFLSHFDSIYAEHEADFSELPDSMRLRLAQTSTVALDVPTGAIRVLIGGRNFDESKFNRAISAKRQPGSAFKPFVYTAAMEHGFTPASVILDQPITLMTTEGEWRPENYDHVFSGPMTIRRALAKSVNLVAIQVLTKVGPEIVIDYARRMGLKNHMNPVPSLAIGACEATPMELTAAYSIFANRGVYAEPYFIDKIVDKTGRVLETHTTSESEVLSQQTSFLMASLMRTVVCCGTGASIPGLGLTRPAAGKTGTTNDYSDAWFVGYTPQIACGVWAGVDERRSLGRGVTGTIAAIPTWVKTMVPLHRKLPTVDFERPSGIETKNICSESHLVATATCPKAGIEFFLEDTELDTCEVHRSGGGRKNANMINMFGAPKQPRREETRKKRPLMF